MSSLLATLRSLWSALTQPQPAELAALPDPQARADSAALLSVAALAVLLLLGLVFIRPQAPRQPPPPAVPIARSSAEAA